MDRSYNKIEDEQLVEWMRQGDLDAFGELFQRYSERLLDFAFQLIRDKEDAADILQDIFASLWNRRSELDFTHSLKAWLYQAVRFQAAKYIHKSQRKRVMLEEMVRIWPQVESLLPDSSLQTEQLSIAIKAAINDMPVRMKEVFVLSRQEQLSHREIGNRLNIAESTVKKTVQNALRFIRSKTVIHLFILLLSKIF